MDMVNAEIFPKSNINKHPFFKVSFPLRSFTLTDSIEFATLGKKPIPKQKSRKS